MFQSVIPFRSTCVCWVHVSRFNCICSLPRTQIWSSFFIDAEKMICIFKMQKNRYRGLFVMFVCVCFVVVFSSFFFSLGSSIHLLQKHWFIATFMIDSVSCPFVVFLTVNCHLCSEYFLLNFGFLLKHNQYSLLFQIYRLELILLKSLKTY